MTKNEAIALYLKAQSKVHGLGSVILLPEFEGNDNDGWLPSGDGVRSTKKDDTSFIRLGSVVLGDGLRTSIRLTNNFMPTEELVSTLDTICATAGSKIPGKLIAIEAVTPFRKVNAELDLKYADRTAGIVCRVDDQPIYRQIVHKYSSEAQDILVQHTNRDEISTNARGKVKAVSPGIMEASKKKVRMEELQAIPKTQRTVAQKAELAELLED